MDTMQRDSGFQADDDLFITGCAAISRLFNASWHRHAGHVEGTWKGLSMAFTRAHRLAVLSCLVLSLGALPAGAAPGTAVQDQAAPPGEFCTDGMETIPYTDDSDSVPISDKTDGGCQSAQDAIAI